MPRDAGLWRAAGSLGKAWRLHAPVLPAETRDHLRNTLLSLRAVLLPWHDGGAEEEQLLAMLGTLAGKAPASAPQALRPDVVADAAVGTTAETALPLEAAEEEVPQAQPERGQPQQELEQQQLHADLAEAIAPDAAWGSDAAAEVDAAAFGHGVVRVSKCPSGHPLAPLAPAGCVYVCDACQEDIPRDALVLECSPCDWCLCDRCSVRLTVRGKIKRRGLRRLDRLEAAGLLH